MKATQEVVLGEYTLGLLSPRETADAHQLLGKDEQAVIQALQWEDRLLVLTDILPTVDPSPLLIQHIQTALGHDTTPALSSLYRQPAVNKPANTGPSAPPPVPLDKAESRPSTPPAMANASLARQAGPKRKNPSESSSQAPAATTAATVATSQSAQIKRDVPDTPHRRHADKPKGNIWLWRATSVILALIALFLGLMPKPPVAPPITVVEVAPTLAAILQAPGQSSTPGWVLTVDHQRNVLLNPQVRSDIPAESSVQLWTHDRNMPQPRSLGLIDPNQPVTVPAGLMGEISAGQIFEMTLEPKGGSPVASPSGPVLFIGRLVSFGEPPADAAAGANSLRGTPPAGDMPS